MQFIMATSKILLIFIEFQIIFKCVQIAIHIILKQMLRIKMGSNNVFMDFDSKQYYTVFSFSVLTLELDFCICKNFEFNVGVRNFHEIKISRKLSNRHQRNVT